MRKYDFAWMLPVCMLAIVVAIGSLLLSAAGLISVFPADRDNEAYANQEEMSVCGVVDSSAAADDQALKVLTSVNPGEAAVVQAGQALFSQNCAQCHAINEVVVGPALRDITKRRPVAWIIPWVKNSSKMVASGDEYGVKIFNLYQQQQMPSFQLSDEEIESIVAYIENPAERARWVVRASASR